MESQVSFLFVQLLFLHSPEAFVLCNTLFLDCLDDVILHRVFQILLLAVPPLTLHGAGFLRRTGLDALLAQILLL